jgi:hypothetical protein
VSKSACVFVVAPGLVALIVICELPKAAAEEAVSVNVTETGLPTVGLADEG